MARVDHLDETADIHSPWYARWWLRMRRSKYKTPHQGNQEKARRVRQRLKREAA